MKGQGDQDQVCKHIEIVVKWIQPGAVKLVLWHHWRHVTQVHPVTSESQFHCTRLYNREVNKTRETRRVWVRPMSLAKHSWRVEHSLMSRRRVWRQKISLARRMTSRKEVKPLVTSRSRVWRQKISLARRMPISSRCHFFFLFRLEAYHEELNVHEKLLLFTLAVDEDESAEIDQEMRQRVDVKPPNVRFDLNKTRTLSVEWLTIPFFAKRTQVPQSARSEIKKKKDWCAKEKKSQIKSPRKSNPPQYLWGCFEGVFVPDLTRLGMRSGVFVPDLTRSGVRAKSLGLVWTSGPTRSDRDQHQTRSRTRHRNLTRLVSHVLLTSLIHTLVLVSFRTLS